MLQGSETSSSLNHPLLFLNCVTGVMTDRLGCSSKGCKEWFIVSCYGDVSLSLTHSLTFCFVGLDLSCCTPGDLLFLFQLSPLNPSLPSSLGDSRLRRGKDINL